ATGALGALKYGQLQIIPERFTKIYNEWLEGIRDWNISRQLWWGHRIPAWYCDTCGQITVAREDPPVCAHCGSGRIHQDPDVLDTWFSSWLWPFSTLGWPDDTHDLRRYYPTSVLETGYDIIFFWVARMVMAGIHFLGIVPFHTIYLHGLVRDEQGRRMSKSFGNGIDPIDVIEQYGTDALRFTLMTSSTPGNNTNLSMNRIVGNRNFANKLWNASRFVIGQTEDIAAGVPPFDSLKAHTLADRWIISRAERLTSSVSRLMDEYQFGEAGRQIFEFIWSEYCDWYIEVAKMQLQQSTKDRENTAQILRAVLDRTLRLLHPFMPFVTEEIWQHLYADTPPDQRPASALIIAPWPEMAGEEQATRIDAAAEEQFGLLQEIITRIRDARKQAGVEPGRLITVILAGGAKSGLLKQQATLLAQLARTEAPRIERRLATKPEQALALVAGGVEVYLPLTGMLDIQKELARLDTEIEAVRTAIQRSKSMLNNPMFVERARPTVVEKERDTLAASLDTLAKLTSRRTELAG
ncbi:MAG: valine--tRNA ligase, partial [Chloroflexi bacterium]